MAPFRERLLATSGIDLFTLIDEAVDAAGQADLAKLADRVGQASRLTLAIAAADRNQIRKHVLEFVLPRFRAPFYQQYSLAEPLTAPATRVSLVAEPPLQLPAELQNGLNEIRAVQLADSDLDGRLDLIVLDSAGVHVFAEATTRSPGARSFRCRSRE